MFIIGFIICSYVEYTVEQYLKQSIANNAKIHSYVATLDIVGMNWRSGKELKIKMRIDTWQDGLIRRYDIYNRPSGSTVIPKIVTGFNWPAKEDFVGYTSGGTAIIGKIGNVPSYNSQLGYCFSMNEIGFEHGELSDYRAVPNMTSFMQSHVDKLHVSRISEDGNAYVMISGTVESIKIEHQLDVQNDFFPVRSTVTSKDRDGRIQVTETKRTLARTSNNIVYAKNINVVSKTDNIVLADYRYSVSIVSINTPVDKMVFDIENLELANGTRIFDETRIKKEVKAIKNGILVSDDVCVVMDNQAAFTNTRLQEKPGRSTRIMVFAFALCFIIVTVTAIILYRRHFRAIA